MTRRTNPLRWLLPAILAYALGFSAAAWDLPLNQALYNPDSLFCILMECFGWYPAFVPAVLYALLLAACPAPPSAPPWQRRMVGGVAAAGGIAALYATSRGYMLKRGLLAGGGDPIGLLWLAAGVLLAAGGFYMVLRCGAALRGKLAFFARWGSVYMLANQAVIYLVKLLWARARFDEMLAKDSFELFTPWFLPFGPGGSSFPSGHTANMAGIFMLLVLCDLFPGWMRRKNWVTLFAWSAVALMAAARVIIGRHFLSDTLAASAMMAVLFFVMHSTAAYQKGLRLVLKNTAPPPVEKGVS